MVGQFDLIVIGSGPAGFYAALEGSRLGLQTALVESGEVGGTGMRTGAVPVKRLLHRCKSRMRSLDYLRRYHPELAERLETAQAAGAERPAGAAQTAGAERPRELDEVLEDLRGDLVDLENLSVAKLRQAGVELIRGEAGFCSTRTLSVAGTEYRGGTFVIATGSRPAGYPGISLDGKAFVSHRDLFDPSAPRFYRLIVLGGDIEGVEFAQAFALFGVEVTVIEMERELLPGVDDDLKAPVLRRLAELCVRVETGRRAVAGSYAERERSSRYRYGHDGRLSEKAEARVELEDGTSLAADAVLITGSRSLNFPEGLELTGIEYGDGGISVDGRLRCSVPGFFAAGEITGRGGPANVAAVQGISAAAEAAACLSPGPRKDMRTPPSESFSPAEEQSTSGIPGVGPAAPPEAIFTIPEIAGVGATERDLQRAGRAYRVRKMELSETWRGFADSVSEGFVKLLIDEGCALLGCWWSAENAAEVASMHAIAAQVGHATLEGSAGPVQPPKLGLSALLKAPFIHPTMAEAYRDILLSDRNANR